MGLLTATLTRAKYGLAAACDELAFVIGNLPARFTSVARRRTWLRGRSGQRLDVYALPECKTVRS